MSGQMSLFDFIEDPEEQRKNSKVEQARKELRELSKRLEKLNEPEPVPRICRHCDHFQRSVWGLMEYHGMACFGFGVSRSSDANQKGCSDWAEAKDDEPWRNSDDALRAWYEELPGTQKRKIDI